MSRAPSADTELRAAQREGERRERGEDPSLGHAADLERLFEAHRASVFRLGLRLTGDPRLAEELVQDTLETAWRKLPEFDGRARFGPWIFGIARLRARNLHRKKGELLTEDGLLDPTGAAVDALRGLQRQERAALLAEAARGLNAVEQEVVHTRYVEDLPLARIDEILGLSGSGARGVLQRCKRKLKQALEERLLALDHGSSFFRTGS